MFHIHITVGMLTTSQDRVHILLHVLSSCVGVLSFPPVSELHHIQYFLTAQYSIFQYIKPMWDIVKYLILAYPDTAAISL